jgi:quinol-cytochrome oxidoreductase complex cytochrome b subunit
MSHDDLARARSILFRILAVEVGVLVLTGVALFFLYRPSPAEGWGDVFGRGYRWDVRVAHGLGAVHELTSMLAIPTALATGVVLALGGRGSHGRWRGTAVGAGMAVATLAVSFTGYLLPWDQLALRAVTVGTNLRGYSPLFDPDVRFVLVGGVELSPGTVLWWLLVHAVVLTPALVGLVLLGWRRHRAYEAGAPEPAPR